MGKGLKPTRCSEFNSLSILGWKLIHVTKSASNTKPGLSFLFNSVVADDLATEGAKNVIEQILPEYSVNQFDKWPWQGDISRIIPAKLALCAAKPATKRLYCTAEQCYYALLIFWSLNCAINQTISNWLMKIIFAQTSNWTNTHWPVKFDAHLHTQRAIAYDYDHVCVGHTVGEILATSLYS